MSAGGSYDMATHFCKEILGTKAPYAMGGYEWFTIGGKKMSSSKGIGSSAKEVAGILPPEVFRFMQVRTPIKTHLDFNPYGDTIPNLFDDYDRCLNTYFDKLENKTLKSKAGEVALDFARIAELSQVKQLPKKRLFLPRFRTIANLLKVNTDLIKFFTEQKKSYLTKEETKILEERIIFANIYLKNYAKNEEKKETHQQTNQFIPSKIQKKFLLQLFNQLEQIKKDDKEIIQDTIFNSIKKTGIKPKEAFNAFYMILTGKPFGPKAADILIDFGIKNFLKKVSQLS
jgi:lysyl-tRNA synthetase class 1